MGRPSHWTGNDSHDDGWAFPPPILFLHGGKKRTGRGRSKRKNASAGRSAQAQTSCRRRGMVGSPLRQSGTETRCPWGNLQPGEVWDTFRADFRCRWPVVDGASATGGCPHPPVVPISARGGQRQRKEKLVNAMTTPTRSAPSATGRQYRPGRRPRRARRPGKIGAGTDTPTPVARGGPLHRSALSAFFSSTGRGAFSFWARPKGAPAAPRAVGRGGARERAQFSPQAETELSGLCDDTMGGASRWTNPLREQNPPRPTFGGPHFPARGCLTASP